MTSWLLLGLFLVLIPAVVIYLIMAFDLLDPLFKPSNKRKKQRRWGKN